MYPHREDFMDTISEYIDFSDNEELWQEAERMIGLGQSILEEGLEQGIRAMVLDNLEEQVPKDRIIDKLKRHFKLDRERAEEYFERFAGL